MRRRNMTMVAKKQLSDLTQFSTLLPSVVCSPWSVILKSLLSISKPDQSLLIGRATSSALVKQIAKNGKVYVVSSEIYDALNKLLKYDDECATGNIQFLCKLFSGERVMYHYIMPFSILCSTQIQNAVKLIARMDQGHSFIDRLLIPCTHGPATNSTSATGSGCLYFYRAYGND